MRSPELERYQSKFEHTGNADFHGAVSVYRTSPSAEEERESVHSDPMDCSPQGSSVHGILQARILEWVAISFSNAYVGVYLFMLI